MMEHYELSFRQRGIAEAPFSCTSYNRQHLRLIATALQEYAENHRDEFIGSGMMWCGPENIVVKKHITEVVTEHFPAEELDPESP